MIVDCAQADFRFAVDTFDNAVNVDISATEAVESCTVNSAYRTERLSVAVGKGMRRIVVIELQISVAVNACFHGFFAVYRTIPYAALQRVGNRHLLFAVKSVGQHDVKRRCGKFVCVCHKT